VVLAVGAEQVALVSLDLGRAPSGSITDAIRRRIKDGAGVTACFLVASHTHHGPVLELDRWPAPEKPYVRSLEDKLTGAILEAANKLQVARLGAGSVDVPLNRNRHSKRPDKPVDRELLVLRLETSAGKV